jgi:hypothetical protein
MTSGFVCSGGDEAKNAYFHPELNATKARTQEILKPGLVAFSEML